MKKNIGLIIQGILVLVLIGVLISSIFINNLFIYCKFLVGFILIVMSINNHYYFKRKYLTLIYAITGVLVISGSILQIING